MVYKSSKRLYIELIHKDIEVGIRVIGVPIFNFVS